MSTLHRPVSARSKESPVEPSEKATDLPLSSSSSDVEAGAPRNKEEEDDGKPHYPVWQWVLTLIGLYLGALLYGLSGLVPFIGLY